MIINKAISSDSGLRPSLVEAGFELVEAVSAGQALNLLWGERHDFIVARSGELLKDNLGLELRRLAPLGQIAALAAEPSLIEMMECLTLGCSDYIADTPENYPHLVASLVAAGRKIQRWRAAFGTI